MAVDTAKRLYGPAAQATSATTRYTVPASTKTIIRQILVCNTASASATITISIGTDAAGTRLFDAAAVPAKSTLDIQGFIVMDAAEVMQVTASATTVTLAIFGIETL